MGKVSKKVAKKSKKVAAKKIAAKVTKAATKSEAQPIQLAVPVDRSIPQPLRSPAKTTMRIILEHVYWLGDALKVGDKARAQREVDELARWAKHYHVFAGNPGVQKIKYSSAVDEYGKDKRSSRLGQVTDDSDVDS